MVNCKVYTAFFVLISFVIIVDETSGEVCYRTAYHKKKDNTRCGWFGWRRCSKYSSERKTVSYCCPGWTGYFCTDAFCAGRTNNNGACHRWSSPDKIIFRDGSTQTFGGGNCTSPNVCENCNNGFYNDGGGYCSICPKIPHCKYRACTTVIDNHCEYCDGEIINENKKYWRAYIRRAENHYKTCDKACSWRPDSTRCYPGNCSDDTPGTCKCIEGFGGYQCDTITRDSTILFALAKLTSQKETDDPVETPVDPNDPVPRETKWTNNILIKNANLKLTAVFKSFDPPPPPPDSTGRDHFVTELKYGITRGEMRLELIRDTNFTIPPIVKPCHVKWPLPTTEQYNCNSHSISFDAYWNEFLRFKHDDQVVFSFQITNGGHLKYINRDVYPKDPEKAPRAVTNFIGRTVLRKFIFHWDLNNPEHTCVHQHGMNCTQPPVLAPDITSNSSIVLRWDGWGDDLSGVGGYAYEVFALGNDGTSLSEDQGTTITDGKNIQASDTTHVFKVNTPGMYSVVFTTIDKAGNKKTARTVFLYDDASKVELNDGKTIRVQQSSKATEYKWVDVDDAVLDIKWPGRFKNENHYKQLWLESVKPRIHVNLEYDDHYGKRQTSGIPHRQGIVRFETQLEVSSGITTEKVDFTPTRNVLDESAQLAVGWSDGERLDITVRAFDIFDVYMDDVVTVYKDTSPPEIVNLWLSRGKRVNISVHGIEDFSKMIIEWNAFDYDSGLDRLEWRLFDNYTKTDIIHGHANMHAQGNTTNKTECEAKYGNAPRGPSCYCTPFHGCFHKHFYVKPDIVKDAGLTPGKDKGIHDSDYYIEVSVINKAQLKSLVVKKITIDVSPPHEGAVHDGMKGFPEVDYQQDFRLNAHWEGFFDRESGVEFYQYIFSQHCFTKEEFRNSSQINYTYNTFASYDVLVEGTFYISVVAVNHAEESSSVVCSDGVTVITDIPTVTNFIMEGAKTRPRLFKDRDGTTWFFDSQLKRHLVENITSSCSSSEMENIAVFPIGNPLPPLNNNYCGTSGNLSILAVVSKSSQLKMSWNPNMNDSLIHDYEIGLSSTVDSLAPDLVDFRSSKHHTHFRLNHPDVPDGTLFFVIVKSISKSAVEGIQSIGPFIIDTTKPRFSGSQIDVYLENGILIANWSPGAFEDPDDPYPMKFQYAVGHQPNMIDIQPFRDLQFVGSCKRTTPATCTSLQTCKLDWSLHGHHDYYFTIKATNLAGLFITKTSEPYTYDVQLPAEGIVLDVAPTSSTSLAKDIEDIDFSTDTTTLAVQWSGFVHPHQTVVFRACVGTVPNSCDVTPMENAMNEYHTFKGLSLKFFQKYFITLEANSSAGSIKKSSDGVQILDINRNLTGMVVRDGINCSNPEEVSTSHHNQDTRPKCTEDTDYQTSTTTFNVYWTIPMKHESYIRESFVKIEEQLVDGVWLPFRKFQYIGRHRHATLDNMNLKPGKTYRAAVKFCAEELCFLPSYSNGITVIFNPPATGNVSVEIQNKTNLNQLIVTFEKMYDPDVDNHKEATEMVNMYEWTLGDNVGIHTKWMKIQNSTTDDNHVQFTVSLNDSLDFSKCRIIYIRGYNKAGVWSTVSKEIKNCQIDDGDSLIVPNVVIDAIGKQEFSMDGNIRDGYGHDIYLEENERWRRPDVDYTPFKNILSATWPLLRHKNYTWAVIDSENLDVTSYYEDDSELHLGDPCSHPDAIKCGFTEKEYVNVNFNLKEQLEHGKRYLICIHAPRRKTKYEKWIEVLNEVNTCSDGVTVDLTPPTPGHVWTGVDPSLKYQSSTSDLFVSWEPFTDVEEYNMAVHTSGIQEYQVGIGSTKGGNDIAAYTTVGLVNHYTFHGLRLQNGHEYYATVKGVDFSTRSSVANSHPVKIDNTPPEKSNNPIQIEGRHLSNLSEINACWRDVFLDKESGIDHYVWSVGSHPGHDDIIPFTRTSLDCGVSAEDKTINIQEGHAYFITVKAINRAKLISTASSWAYVYDMSPPISGHVYDGCADISLSYMKDIDYQTDTRTLSSYWEGFHDPHSTIRAYYVSIGTCPNCENILTNQDIGLSKNFTLCHMHLGSGIRYYTTITACNTADLCTSVTSDGVIIDNSPPTQGIILDGVDVHDMEYQSLRNYIAAKWYGFTDPQSGIDRFSWRVGTKPGSDDIVKSTHLPLTDILVEPNLPQKLPLGQRIYITVKAYNKAGLSTEATSNGFYIDESTPLMKVKPHLSTDLGSIKYDSVVFRSTIRVRWEVEDEESFIERQYLSVASHKGGEFNKSSMELNGIVREYTFSRLDLHDGGNYTIKLIICNGAKLCIEGETRGIVVDSSPPTPGMFAIRTDHAANLHRHVDGWMTWSRYKLWLSWLGFTDLHTGIDKYYVSLGSKYMMDDLNKIAGSPKELFHNQSGVDKDDEGFVQTFEVETKNMAKFEHVFVSVWAVNHVGLSSRMIHSQFRLVPGGSLELIRRCSSVTCLGHCVCAAQGKRCSLNGNACNDVTKSNNNNLLGVYDVTDIRLTSPFTDMKYTPSNVALAAKWQVIQAQGLRPLWYEWSAGLSSKEQPEGVFHNLAEDVWHHAGQSNQAVFNLKRYNVLKESPVSYSVFVRAWYDDDTYADFVTNGISALSTSLATRKVKGAAVVEKIPGHWKKDIDYIKSGSPFSIIWKNVFIGDSEIIDRFKVYLSTYPGGHDVHVLDTDLSGSVTSYNISRVPLTPGIIFYSNIVGYSFSGIHATQSSDGIMVDSVPPLSGTVYDGIGVNDIDYQNSSTFVGSSWHGFSDRDSGITHYMWCVQTQSADMSCDIKDWENVGLHRSVSRTLNTSSLATGSEIESLVYAVDFIGHKSNPKRSNGVLIDTTHPEPTFMEHLDQNIARNPSFEETNGDFINWNNVSNINFCSNLESVFPLHWNTSTGSCTGVLKSDKNIAMDGRAFLFLRGELTQTLINLKNDHLYRVSFVTAHPNILGAVLANKEGYVQIGEKRHVFMVYTKQDKHGSISEEVSWHHHTFYFRSYTSEGTVRIGSMTGNTGILFDNLQVQETMFHKHNDDNENRKHIHAHVVTLHQWSSIHASWSFVDPESPIIDYMWAVGYTEGSTEVQGFTSVGLSNFAYNYNVSLAHTSVVHITVIATNAAGLSQETHAEDLLVDLTPPEISFLYDGIGSDIDAQTTEEISANWNVDDPESGLGLCEWAVGYQPFGNEIQTFQRLPDGINLISKVFPSDKVSMQMVHITLRCINKARLQSTLSSDGVKISNLPPKTTSAVLDILPLSVTEYNSKGHFQGDTSSLRMKWTGFEDIAGIDSYLLTFQSEDQGVEVSKSFIAENQDTAYCVLNGFALEDGNYTTNVQAVNTMYLRSAPVKNEIRVSSQIPSIRESPHMKLTLVNRTVSASWANQFDGNPLYYEVSMGTNLGGVDIIQWQETKTTLLEFELPPKIKSVKNLTGYISVRGVSANGMTALLNAAIKL